MQALCPAVFGKNSRVRLAVRNPPIKRLIASKRNYLVPEVLGIFGLQGFWELVVEGSVGYVCGIKMGLRGLRLKKLR